MRTDLMALIEAIVANDADMFAVMLAASPALARTHLADGATRQSAADFFLPALGRYLMAGDTALHIAATAYRVDMARQLLVAGADPRARNRRGAAPLHDAACGAPGSPAWHPDAQVHLIELLVAAGADPNARDKSGTAPLHKAVRTRCAAAVEALIKGGADITLRTKNGSTPLDLAEATTGRSGSGSVEARAQQALIRRILDGRNLI